jgi:amino acid transporter
VAISAKVLGVLLVAEVLVIFIFDAVIMANGGPEGISFEPFTWSSYTTGNLGVSLIFAIALFSGFEATAIYREETRNPDRTIPRATYIVVLFIGLFYALSAWTMITALGPSQAVSLAHADPANVFFGAATQFGGAWLYLSASVLLVTSMFAACLAIQNVTTRYIYSMSVDGILPRAMGVAHERHHSPHRASFAVGMFYFIGTGTSLLAGLSGENIYAWFAGMAAFGLICALAITSGAVIAYFLRHPGVATVWKGVIAPSIALIGLLVFVYLGYENFPALIGGSRVMANFMTVTFAVVFGLGYFIAASLRRNRPDVYARIGRQ